MNLDHFLEKLQNSPETISFSDTMSVIETLYTFTETVFKNGELRNTAGQNSGSCKLFAFAKEKRFSKVQTLACFGSYYRDEVLLDSNGNTHPNIRNFMKTGWDGIVFEGKALAIKI